MGGHHGFRIRVRSGRGQVRDVQRPACVQNAVVHAAAEAIAHGGGIPFIFNDEAFVKALHDRGIAIEDARANESIEKLMAERTQFTATSSSASRRTR